MAGGRAWQTKLGFKLEESTSPKESRGLEVAHSGVHHKHLTGLSHRLKVTRRNSIIK